MGPSSYKTAFTTARKEAGLTIRFYDARHTFVTRLAENPLVSEETIRQLAGHVSPRMLGRYAHIRAQARRDAIASLEKAEPDTGSAEIQTESPQSQNQLSAVSSHQQQKTFTNQGIRRGSPGRIRTSDMTVNSRLEGSFHPYRPVVFGMPQVPVAE